MFEILYKDPATIERYRLTPLLKDRERYLCAVVASGVVDDVARRVARAQLTLMDLLNPAPVTCFAPASISTPFVIDSVMYRSQPPTSTPRSISKRRKRR